MIVSAGKQHATGIAGKSKREDCSDDGNAPSIRCAKWTWPDIADSDVVQEEGWG